ncbi:MAG TPA: coenzyme F420-0:L-glutamate ligase, partial [Gaiellaceae bacterium]|nr:coenzyme F420-0:L-glutamate ligase [Gaiellaceae bacterium]
CASAGVDQSNAGEADTLVLLPLDPDASARALADRLGVGLIVSDSFGRPFRQGTIDVAIGVAGLPPLLDLRGTRDSTGYELRTTAIAVADEIAGAAELVMGKTNGVPAAIVRGLELKGDGAAADLVMPADRDLFR